MEFAIFFLLIVTFTVHILCLRHFFGQLAKRLKAIEERVSLVETNFRGISGLLQNTFAVPSQPASIPNDIDQKEEGIEFSEHNPMSLPPDVKFEIEGGDTAIPPNYN